jgi:nucleoid-associated protein EbfC
MNIQAMMKQAQKMQQDMVKIKNEINEKIFPGKYSFIEVEVNGKKEVLKVSIGNEIKLEENDKEFLEDMIVLAINDAMKKVDQELEEKMGKFAPGLTGMF